MDCVDLFDDINTIDFLSEKDLRSKPKTRYLIYFNSIVESTRYCCFSDMFYILGISTDMKRTVVEILLEKEGSFFAFGYSTHLSVSHPQKVIYYTVDGVRSLIKAFPILDKKIDNIL